MTHIPPSIIARADQLMAAVNTELDAHIEQFRRHMEQHNGEIVCPWCTVSIFSRGNPGLPELFAAAIARLAREEKADTNA